MAPEALAQVLRPLRSLFPSDAHPDLLVGLGVADDAAVYRLSDDRALVATTDFFTPVVDDPFAYGAIAAANAMSDVYAMGGEMLLALNLAGLPADLPPEIASEIFRGAAEKVREAGAVVAGGHTTVDKEPKFGLVALGIVHPDRILTKGGACVGDRLILTKRLGSGVVTTAFMRDLTQAGEIEAATTSMARLNRRAAEVAVDVGVRSMTDITGFGLLGHSAEMWSAEEARLQAEGDGASVGFVFEFGRLPFLPGAMTHGEEWIYPGGAHNNRKFFDPRVRFLDLPEWQQVLCYAPETSGGLLMAVPAAREAEVLERLEGEAWTIGEVVDRPGIVVRP